jgi:hypothetical protein
MITKEKFHLSVIEIVTEADDQVSWRTELVLSTLDLYVWQSDGIAFNRWNFV